MIFTKKEPFFFESSLDLGCAFTVQPRDYLKGGDDLRLHLILIYRYAQKAVVAATNHMPFLSNELFSEKIPKRTWLFL